MKRHTQTQLKLFVTEVLPDRGDELANEADGIGNKIFPNVDGARLGEASNGAAVTGVSVGDALTGEMLRAEARDVLIDCLARHEDAAALFAHHVLIYLAGHRAH